MEFEKKKFKDLDKLERASLLLQVKAIYAEKFPALLIRRMEFRLHIFNGYKNQTTAEILSEFREERRPQLICSFSPWDKTKQGGEFWGEVVELYKRNPTASNDTIRNLFKKHNVL